MILTDCSLRELVNNSALVSKPWPDDVHYQPASIDLLLGNSFIFIDFKWTLWQRIRNLLIGRIKIKGLGRYCTDGVKFTIPAHRFVLAETKSTIYVPPGYVGRVEGKSSVGRKGLWIHNAGFIDPGFKGKLTLELYNATYRNIELVAGETLICQFAVHLLDSLSNRNYGDHGLNSHYQNQIGVSMSHE